MKCKYNNIPPQNIMPYFIKTVHYYLSVSVHFYFIIYRHFAPSYVKPPMQDFLTLDFCPFIDPNPDARTSHVGILLTHVLKPRRKNILRRHITSSCVQPPVG